MANVFDSEEGIAVVKAFLPINRHKIYQTHQVQCVLTKLPFPFADSAPPHRESGVIDEPREGYIARRVFVLGRVIIE